MPPSVPVAGIGSQMKIRIMIPSTAPERPHRMLTHVQGVRRGGPGVHRRDGPANHAGQDDGGAEQTQTLRRPAEDAVRWSPRA